MSCIHSQTPFGHGFWRSRRNFFQKKHEYPPEGNYSLTENGKALDVSRFPIRLCKQLTASDMRDILDSTYSSFSIVVTTEAECLIKLIVPEREFLGEV